MQRTAAISLRVTPQIKEAVERAAYDDSRTVASLLDKLLKEFLREQGYLTSARKPT
jgi:hypothetical protein